MQDFQSHQQRKKSCNSFENHPNSEHSKKGRFITFEGGDGCGKSTIASLLYERLQEQGRDVLLLHEPGSTPVGEKIRKILLDCNTDINSRTELLLYEAARAQMVHEVVKPAIKAGKIVICDRFNDSTMAYQGYARGLGKDIVGSVDKIAINKLVVDRTILMLRDTSDALHAARSLHNEHGEPDRLESEPVEFHMCVNDAFRKIAQAEPWRVRCVVMKQDVEETYKEVYAQLSDLF